jgi:hypothetical protein
MATKSFIGIKRIWYGTPITAIADADDGLTSAEVLAKIAEVTTKEVKNVHQDTWGYEEADPTILELKNMLSRGPYYRDAEEMGVPTISFTLGEYEYETKAAFQGGKFTADTWERPFIPDLVEMCIIAMARTGELIVYPRASVIGKGNYVDTNIGVGVTAVPLETGVEGLSSEKWFRGVVVPQG